MVKKRVDQVNRIIFRVPVRSATLHPFGPETATVSTFRHHNPRRAAMQGLPQVLQACVSQHPSSRVHHADQAGLVDQGESRPS